MAAAEEVGPPQPAHEAEQLECPGPVSRSGDDEANVDEDKAPSMDVVLQLKSALLWVKKAIMDNFLVFTFAVALTIAMSSPAGGKAVGRVYVGEYRIVSFLNTCVVFFISGLALKLNDLQSVWKQARYFALGVVQINFVTTLMALFFLNVTFIKEDYRAGFAIFNTVPTTLGVGVALTQLAKGDTVLSLLLTVSTNILGTVITPLLLRWYFENSNLSNQDGSSSVDIGKLVTDLLLSVCIPTVIGILLRNYVPAIGTRAQAYKVELSMFSHINLACIVWMALSLSRDLILEQDVADIFKIIALSIATYVFFLVGNHFLVGRHALDLPLPQAISITIMASQKSNPVALAVIRGLGVDDEKSGLYAIPCIIGQLCQIFIGSAVARYYVQQVKQLEARQVPTSEAEEKDTPANEVEIVEIAKTSDAEEGVGSKVLCLSASGDVEAGTAL